MLRVDKQRKITAHDEGIRLLGQLQGFCELRQDAIIGILGPANADIYSGITLTEYDWTRKQERIVAALAL